MCLLGSEQLVLDGMSAPRLGPTDKLTDTDSH